MNKPATRRRESGQISHNLLGQRLGRKGRGTRERILAAAERLLAEPRSAFSLSAVAREASLGMTTLYLYFADLTELLLAVLAPVMATAEDSYIAQLRTRWPDEELGRECFDFVMAFHGFWDRHSRILHLRNAQGAALDPRLAQHRIQSTMPLIRLLMIQMDADVSVRGSLDGGVATALLTGIERLLTLVTDPEFTDTVADHPEIVTANMLRGQAHILALAIRDGRQQAALRSSVSAPDGSDRPAAAPPD